MQRSLSPGFSRECSTFYDRCYHGTFYTQLLFQEDDEAPLLTSPIIPNSLAANFFAVCFSYSWLASGERKLSANGKINSALCPKSSLVLASENCPERHFPSGPLFFLAPRPTKNTGNPCMTWAENNVRAPRIWQKQNRLGCIFVVQCPIKGARKYFPESGWLDFASGELC